MYNTLRDNRLSSRPIAFASSTSKPSKNTLWVVSKIQKRWFKNIFIITIYSGDRLCHLHSLFIFVLTNILTEILIFIRFIRSLLRAFPYETLRVFIRLNKHVIFLCKLHIFPIVHGLVHSWLLFHLVFLAIFSLNSLIFKREIILIFL